LTTAESIIKQIIDNETQTDEQSQDKHAQVNNKLKRALQTIKDKIHQAVVERPELFSDTGDDTIERLDHLISTVANQATQIDILQNERINEYENQIRSLTNEHDNLLQRNQQLEKDILEIQSNVDRYVLISF
jgi:predicted  nucleic acid-binding Zn-ribbon protein